MAESYLTWLRRGDFDHFHHISGPYLLRYALEAAGKMPVALITVPSPPRDVVGLEPRTFN